MKLATGILAAALLLWGWHNALLLVAVPLAIIIELPRWTPWRWDLSDKDFQRLADASTVGFILLAAYQFDAHGASGIYAILRWLPVALFPLVATQVYSTRDRVDYTALFWSVRAAVARGWRPVCLKHQMRDPCWWSPIPAMTSSIVVSQSARTRTVCSTPSPKRSIHGEAGVGLMRAGRCLRRSKTWVALTGFNWVIKISPCTWCAPPCWWQGRALLM